MSKKRGERKTCHYCGERATTRDHIVPRSRAVFLGGRLGPMNIVPACAPCNSKKSDFRSDCMCIICKTAWETLGPVGWEKIPIVKIVDLEGLQYV